MQEKLIEERAILAGSTKGKKAKGKNGEKANKSKTPKSPNSDKKAKSPKSPGSPKSEKSAKTQKKPTDLTVRSANVLDFFHTFIQEYVPNWNSYCLMCNENKLTDQQIRCDWQTSLTA